jgi:hypothetical protein
MSEGTWKRPSADQSGNLTKAGDDVNTRLLCALRVFVISFGCGLRLRWDSMVSIDDTIGKKTRTPMEDPG